jgi:hypothetical protein
MYVARHLLAEAKAIAEREFPDGLARWEVRPFSDGWRPGEDRFASLFKPIRGDRNALLDPVPAHPLLTAPNSSSSTARAPPD